jgi:hypothetical protein
MLPLTPHFEAMLTATRPPQERRELAQTLPDEVRDHLAGSDKLDTVDDAPVTHLAGSYARHTSQDDIKDVDILVFVASSYESEEPEVVLDDLAAALKGLEVEGYGEGTIKTRRRGRRSHHVEFTHPGTKIESFHIDVVPVIRPGDDKTAILRIPDREWERWDDTQPIGYAGALSDLNGRHDGNVVPLIRMLKRIKNEHLYTQRRPKSFWLESATFNAVRDGRVTMTGSHADRIAGLLTVLRSDCGPTPMPIYDPCLGRNMTESWEQEEYDRFVKVLDMALTEIHAIRDEADEDVCIAAWQRIFGPVFAADEKKAAAAAEAQAVGRGGSKVTSTGRILPAASPVIGIATPEHRYFGD